MKFVNIRCQSNADELIAMLTDCEKTNRGVVFDEKLGTPIMRTIEKDGRVKIKCELNNRTTRDNGFLEGTYFRGSVRHCEGGCQVKGVILTAPVWHGILICMFIAFIVVCLSLGGFSPVPIILIIFDIAMFYTEFKKQGIIFRYILRAVKRVKSE